MALETYIKQKWSRIWSQQTQQEIKPSLG